MNGDFQSLYISGEINNSVEQIDILKITNTKHHKYIGLKLLLAFVFIWF